MVVIDVRVRKSDPFELDKYSEMEKMNQTIENFKGRCNLDRKVTYRVFQFNVGCFFWDSSKNKPIQKKQQT